MMKKVGVFSFTCCEGCVVVLLEALNQKYFEWLKKIKFENFRTLRKDRDRKSVVQGKSVDLGGRRIIKKKKKKQP